MPLSLKLQILVAGTSGIVIVDNTGAYNAQTNPGGWGGPNPNTSQVAGIFVAVTPLSQPQGGAQRLSSQNQTNYLNGTGCTVAPSSGNANPDGVYAVSVRIGFLNSATLSAAAGSYQFTTSTSAATIFAGQDGFSIDELSTSAYYQIDQTQPLTSEGGYVTSPLPIITTEQPTVYQQLIANALVFQAGFACLNRDIAGWAGTSACCEGEDLDALMVRYAEYLAMLNKFNLYGDLAGANALARKLQADCNPRLGVCTPIGTTSSVPFTGNLPTLTLQPSSQQVTAGSEIAFVVAASGTAPLVYQWYADGVIIPGATGSVYMIQNVQTANAGTYYVIVSNAFGSVQSNIVSLTIGTGSTGVVITQQPANASTTIGGTASFTVAATGTATITYQWYLNGNLISGATAATLNLTNVQSANLGNYYCVVSNSVNSVQSNTAILSVGVQVGWGWSAAAPTTTGELQAGQGSATITSGATITADFTANTSPNVLWMYEPLTEPVKTQWYGDPNNNGSIGDPNTDTFVFTTVGSFRVYYTQFQTIQTLEPIQFLVN